MERLSRRDLSPYVRAGALRAFVLGSAWWALAEGQGLAFGAPVVVAATLVSLSLAPPSGPRRRPRPFALVRFFLVGSLLGGWDVARRALSPTLPLFPVLVRFRTRLPPGSARTLFASVLTLMPGTLCALAEGSEITLHALTPRSRSRHNDLPVLEELVARALGVDLMRGDEDDA